eukprot:1348813-Alexandrium_andersonii.AAC.1
MSASPRDRGALGPPQSRLQTGCRARGESALTERLGAPLLKEEQRCQTKGANRRWAGYGRVLG